MQDLVEFPGDSSREEDDSQDNMVVRFRKDSSDDARNVGCRAGSATAMEAWVQTRLENYGQRNGLPANEEISRSLVTAAYIVQTDGLPANEEISRSLVTAAYIVQTDEDRFQGSCCKSLITRLPV